MTPNGVSGKAWANFQVRRIWESDAFCRSSQRLLSRLESFLTNFVGPGSCIASILFMAIEERRSTGDRRRLNPAGRRSSDYERHESCRDLQRELAHLREVMQVLVDAIQSLTASRSKSPGI